MSGALSSNPLNILFTQFTCGDSDMDRRWLVILYARNNKIDTYTFLHNAVPIAVNLLILCRSRRLDGHGAGHVNDGVGHRHGHRCVQTAHYDADNFVQTFWGQRLQDGEREDSPHNRNFTQQRHVAVLVREKN